MVYISPLRKTVLERPKDKPVYLGDTQISVGRRQNLGWKRFGRSLYGREEGMMKMLLTNDHSFKGIYRAPSKC